MGNAIIDLSGRRFGKLVVLRLAAKREKHGGTRWICQCDCGATKNIAGRSLRYDVTTSCGCASRSTIHQPTHRSWQAMRTRCTNTNTRDWPLYGGRGIKICKRWMNSYANFLADMGERPEGMTLDRIDNDGNYEPKNCRWADGSQQGKNKRPFTEAHKQAMRHPKRKGYKQTPEHTANRLASFLRNRALRA